jgi:GNAT superfamily N-acetyltransferase
MDDLSRIRAFIRWTEDTTAERLVPWRFGTALFDDTHPNKYDANYLRVERPVGEATAGDLAAIADDLQSHLGHREIRFEDDDEGARLAAAFASLGYDPERLVTMVLHREPDRPPPALHAGEVPLSATHDLMVRATIAEIPGIAPGAAEMLADHREAAGARIGARCFAAWDGDALAGCCELYVHDGIAQIENVDTLTQHRNRGVARAFLAAAIDAARDAGVTLIFLQADAADWPQQLYGKIGFDRVDHHIRQFTKRPDDA